MWIGILNTAIDNLNLNCVVDPDLDLYDFELPGSVIILYGSG
jgi:hypothetical protein